MHIDDMKAPQRTQIAQTAGHCAFGALLALTHRWVWMTGFWDLSLSPSAPDVSPANSRDLTGYSVLRRFVQAASW